jgi:hypothetical protein
MKRLLALVFTVLVASGNTATAENGVVPVLDAREAIDINLSDFLWVSRLVVVLADSPNDPRFIKQMDFLAARPAELEARDVVVITDTDPEARSSVRQDLRPRGFMLVLIGKDGKPYLRKPAPWDVREITRSIDKMPLRRQEIRDAQNSGGS